METLNVKIGTSLIKNFFKSSLLLVDKCDVLASAFSLLECILHIRLLTVRGILLLFIMICAIPKIET